ncbi:MAG: hypothetical protein ACYTG0_17485 [Planctomycetota bacterium]|jgi:hypothetical protein
MKVLERSFVRFVYPFLFDAESFSTRSGNVDAATLKGRSPLWRKRPFPEGELLPHVARYLNPPEGTPPTARLWKIDGEALQSPQGLGARKSIEWRLVIRQGQEIPFSMDDVFLALFRVGVGFLAVRARPRSTQTDDWLDFVHYFRFVRGGRGVSVRARRRVGVDEAKQPVFEDFFPGFAEQGPQSLDRPAVFGDVLDGLLRSAAPDEEAEPWWSEVFIAGQTLPYVALMTDEVVRDKQCRLLHKLHNFFHSKEGNHPASEDVEPRQPHLLPYADRQWFVFSLDGGAFLACDPPGLPFFRETLPDHLDTQYLLVFILALHQRFTLMSLSEQVTRHWLAPESAAGTGDMAARERVFRRIRDLLLSFTARGHFTQVMQRRHHHRCYLKWQQTFQVDRLFAEVSDEVREMHQYLLMEKTERIHQLAKERKRQAERQRVELERMALEEARRDRIVQDRTQRVEQRLNWLATFFATPALVLAAMEVSGTQSWTWAVAGLLAGIAGGLVLLKLLKAREGKGPADRDPSTTPDDSLERDGS